jgi:hypothetical protein
LQIQMIYCSNPQTACAHRSCPELATRV